MTEDILEIMQVGHTEKVSFKSKKTRVKDKSEWTIIENHHEPIIDKELFEKVQKIRKKRKKKAINIIMDSNLQMQKTIYIQDFCIVEDVELQCIKEKEQVEQEKDQIVIYVKNIAMKVL